MEIRTLGDPRIVMPFLQKQLTLIDPFLMILSMKPMRTLVDESLREQHVVTALTSAFGMMAVILTAVGLYGIMSLNMKSREGELAIRVALGANRGDIIKVVMRRCASLLVWGFLPGATLAIAIWVVLRSFLFGVKAYDPVAWCVVCVMLILSAAVGSFMPARRALKADPMSVLRYE